MSTLCAFLFPQAWTSLWSLLETPMLPADLFCALVVECKFFNQNPDFKYLAARNRLQEAQLGTSAPGQHRSLGALGWQDRQTSPSQEARGDKHHNGSHLSWNSWHPTLSSTVELVKFFSIFPDFWSFSEILVNTTEVCVPCGLWTTCACSF